MAKRPLEKLNIELRGPFITLRFRDGMGLTAAEVNTYKRSEVNVYNADCAVLILRTNDSDAEKKVYGSLADCVNDLGVSTNDLSITPMFIAELVEVMDEIRRMSAQMGADDVRRQIAAIGPTEEPMVNKPMRPPFWDQLSPFEQTALEMGSLVTEKNLSYGNSFGETGAILRIMFPDGIKPEQYQDLGHFFRAFDKWKRIFTKPNAFGENPRKDLLGYAILGVYNSEKESTPTEE